MNVMNQFTLQKNGYGNLETYKEKLAESEKQINNKEEITDAEMVFASMKEKYGEK